MRLAFVGCGAIARWHLAALRAAAARTDVTAAVDVDGLRALAMAKETGAEPFFSLEDALDAGTFEAVLIMVPHGFHEQLAVTAIRAGKHVLLEKPMAPTLDACDRILAASKQSTAVFLVAENAQYWPEVVLTKGLIDDGAVGEVITARAWYCAPPMNEFLGEGNWRFSVAEAGGGVAIDGGSHWLRPLRMWSGELVEVMAATSRPYEAMEGESMCRALCRFDSGVVASFDAILSPGPVAPLPPFQVTGSPRRDRHRRPREGQALRRVQSPRRRCGPGPLYAELRKPDRRVRSGRARRRHSLRRGRVLAGRTARRALAMYRSAESGRWEAVW